MIIFYIIWCKTIPIKQPGVIHTQICHYYDIVLIHSKLQPSSDFFNTLYMIHDSSDCLPLKHFEAQTNGRHFPDDIFKCIFVNENVWI